MSRTFIGGVRLGRWGGYATWPLVKLSADSRGVVIGPSSVWLSPVVPAFTFAWSEVLCVEPTRGGLRFQLRHRVAPKRSRGPGAWMTPNQDRLTFWYRERDWQSLASTIPQDLWRADPPVAASRGRSR